MTGPWEEYQQAPAAPAVRAQATPTATAPPSAEGGPWEDYQPPKAPAPASSLLDTFKALFQSDVESRSLARQGVSPHVFSKYAPAKPRKLGDLEEYDFGPAYKGPSGELRDVNTATDFIATDPETGRRAVFARHTAEAGPEAVAHTNEGPLIRFAREVVPGFATGPVAGIQRTAQVPGAVRTVGTRTGAEIATQRAAESARDARAFQNLEVRQFGPAFNQGPVASVAKQLSETPVVGAPLRNALDESLRDAARAAENVASRFGSASTPETAGTAIKSGLERFKDARPTEIVERAASGYTPEQLSTIIASPARDTSLKTKQAALYERAWSGIPEEMRAGRAVEGMSRFVGGMPETRAVLQEIQTRNVRMINQSAAGAEGAARPIAGGGFVGRMVEAMMNKDYRAALQTMRDQRSDFRRLASGLADTEKNTMRLSDIERVQSAVTRDMVTLLERNAEAYRAIQRHDEARQIARAIVEFRRADRFTRASAERMEKIERLFNAPSAEALYRSVVSSAMSRGRGDLEKLRVLVKTLRGDELNDVRAALIRQMGEPVASARGVTQEVGFSVNSYATRWANMAPEARALLFGHEHTEALNGLFRVASRLANVEALANTSRSGTNALNLAGMLSAGGLAWSGNLGPALGVAGTGATLAVLMSRPAYARWAITYAQLRAAALRAPINVTSPQILAHVNRLAELAKHDRALIPVYRAIAAENGIAETGDQQQPVKNEPRLQ